MMSLKKENGQSKRYCPYPSKEMMTVSLVIKEARVLLSNPLSTQLLMRRCINELSDLVSVNDVKSQVSSSESHAILKILRDYSRHDDSRVRVACLTGLFFLKDDKLDLSLYSEFCESLKDDYEECRIMAVKLLDKLTMIYGDCLVLSSSGEETRLVDDSFARICSMVSDNSLMVRICAAELLGNFKKVSPSFLHQTLDKKLMSNLRKKHSAHSRLKNEWNSGFSSGKKWADDAPQESVCPEEVNLMDIGSCGAFLIGLEDEFKEVRMATLTSMAKLACLKDFLDFAKESLDFFIDMFNDEILEIRLTAIQLLSGLGLHNVVLREDQVTIILAAFQDSSLQIRQALYDLLGNSKLASQDSLRSSVEILLINLQKYPQDKECIWTCLSKLGKGHPEFTSLITRELLGIHPFLELPEPSIEDTSYISLLMLILNAAALDQMGITSQLEHYTQKHYSYLRSAYPRLVPKLSVFEKDSLYEKIPSRFPIAIQESLKRQNESNSGRTFLCDIFNRIKIAVVDKSSQQQTQVIELSIKDLQRLKEVETQMSSACDFLTQYLECQLSLKKILSNNNWINALLLSPLQSSIFRSSLHKILLTTFHLNHKFHGMHPFQITLIQETRVKGLALQLMAIIHGSNASALSLCDAFLEEVKHLKTLLEVNDMKADELTSSMIKNISQLEEPKPGSVARVLQPLFLSTKQDFADNISQMVSTSESVDALERLRVSGAEIIEPNFRSDVVLKFTAGLVLNIKLVAILRNIRDIGLIRVRIKFPDQKTMLFIPKMTDFAVIQEEDKEAIPGVNSYRLSSQVFISHSVWTEACVIELTLVSDLKETYSSVTISQVWAAKTASYSQTGNMSSRQGIKSSNEENMQIGLHQPIKLNILPKSQKKTVL